MLPYVLAYNYPGNIDKFSQIAWAMGENDDGLSNRESAACAIMAVTDLADDVGIPRTLKDLNIPETAIREMAEGAMKVERPILNNPRPMKTDVAEMIYRWAFHGECSE